MNSSPDTLRVGGSHTEPDVQAILKTTSDGQGWGKHLFMHPLSRALIRRQIALCGMMQAPGFQSISIYNSKCPEGHQMVRTSY